MDENNFIKFLKNPIINSYSNNLGVLHIVESQTDIFLGKHRINEWSICACHAILKYAGGNIKDYDLGDELEYNSKYLVHFNYVCYSKFKE